MLQSGSFLSRIVALAILAIVVLAAVQFVVQPVLQSYRDNADRIVTSQELMQRYQALIAERPRLVERIEALDATESSETAYLESADEALAGVQLQDLVSSVVDDSGGEVKSLQVLPAVDLEEGPALRKTGVKLRFSADIDSLAETLFELESIEPLLFVDMVQVGAARARRTGRGAELAPALDVRIDVFAYARQSS